MRVTFLTARDFGDLERKLHRSGKYLHGGFGVGRNVMYVIKDDKGEIYLKLSPIADEAYANHSQEVKDERVKRQIEYLTKEG